MDASEDASRGSGNASRAVRSGGDGSPRSLFVPLSKRAVFVRVLLTYAAGTCAALALIQLAGAVGTRAALGLLVVVLPRIFLGAAMLFEQAPPLEVDAWGGLVVRHPAILGEAFAPHGPAVAVGWDDIERWEAAPETLPFGIPCPWGGSVLRVILRHPEVFMAERGALWGRIRFGWKALRHGTPLVLSDAVLRKGVAQIAEFMAKVRPGGGDGPGGFQVVPLPSSPFVVVVP